MIAKSFIDEHRLSNRKACALVGMSRSQFNYTSRKKEDSNIVRSIIEIKERYPSYGVPRVLATLRRRGFVINAKKVYRIMKTLRLQVPKKRKAKSKFRSVRSNVPVTSQVGDVWSMDFIFDRLKNGSSFRCLTIVDNLSREVPGIFVSKSMSGFLPIDFLDLLRRKTNLPKHIILDNVLTNNARCNFEQRSPCRS